MPRINAEDKWFDDPRRMKLIERIGVIRTDGAALQIWRVAQNYYRLEALIPKDVFSAIDHADDFLAVGLVVEREDGVYVKGSGELFNWIKERKQAGRKGADATNSRKQDESPPCKDVPDTPDDSPQPPANSGKSQQTSAKSGKDRQSPASSSSSSSFSLDLINTNKICSPAAASEQSELRFSGNGISATGTANSPPPKIGSVRFDFEALYQRYPSKQGKKRGLVLCHKQIKTQEQYEALKRAIACYADYHSRPLQRNEFRPTPKHFATFMSADSWPDWIDGVPGDKPKTEGESPPPIIIQLADPERVSEGQPMTIEEMQSEVLRLEKENTPGATVLRRILVRRQQLELKNGVKL